MADETHKSIAVDHDTWEILSEWAEEECRSVGGQIRFLVKQNAPKKSNPPKILTRTFKQEMTTAVNEGWTQKRKGTQRFVLENTQRSHLIDIFAEYGDPLTNTELASLSQRYDVKACMKVTSALYLNGLLKRRDNTLAANNDKYEYQLTLAAIRLLNQRNKKRSLTEEKT